MAIDGRRAAISVCDRTVPVHQMTKLEALEEEIKKLAPYELAQLREWLLERDAEEWDLEIERDAASGKLDRLFEKSVADHRAGKSRKI
jgi:hypothetical protein